MFGPLNCRVLANTRRCKTRAHRHQKQNCWALFMPAAASPTSCCLLQDLSLSRNSSFRHKTVVCKHRHYLHHERKISFLRIHGTVILARPRASQVLFLRHKTRAHLENLDRWWLKWETFSEKLYYKKLDNSVQAIWTSSQDGLAPKGHFLQADRHWDDGTVLQFFLVWTGKRIAASGGQMAAANVLKAASASWPTIFVG